MANGAIRYNEGKLPYHRLPVLALEEVTKTFLAGEEKYGDPDNWRKGLSWRETMGSLLRHAFAWLRGEDYDKSGLSHLAHVVINGLFLLQFTLEGGGTDDRYKEYPKEDTKLTPIYYSEEFKASVQHVLRHGVSQVERQPTDNAAGRCERFHGESPVTFTKLPVECIEGAD